MMARFLFTLCAALLAVTHLGIAEPSEPARTYALIIGGLGGPEPYLHWYDNWTQRFQKYLTRNAGVPAADITTLSGSTATADAITGSLSKLAKIVKPQDQFILFITGHGEIAGASPTLILSGLDLNADTLSASLNAIPSQDQVILNLSASSGDFLKHLVSPFRVNIAATSPTEVNEPVFAEFFLRGLESGRAAAGKSGGINMLDAFNWATLQTMTWIARWRETSLATASASPLASGSSQISGSTPSFGPTTWKASGKETIEIFEKLYAHDSSRKLDPSSDRNAPDAAVDLFPADGVVNDAWQSRRVIGEHAMLEDCGEEIGVATLGEKGFQPILGKNLKDPGYLASRTILGQPAPPLQGIDSQSKTSGTGAVQDNSAAAPAAAPAATGADTTPRQ